MTDPANTTDSLEANRDNIGTAGVGLTVVAPASATTAIASAIAALFSAAQCNKVADHVRRRTQSNVQASTDGDAISKGSHYGEIQQLQKSAVTGNTLTIKNPDGTTLGTLTFTSSPSAEPVTGVS